MNPINNDYWVCNVAMHVRLGKLTLGPLKNSLVSSLHCLIPPTLPTSTYSTYSTYLLLPTSTYLLLPTYFYLLLPAYLPTYLPTYLPSSHY